MQILEIRRLRISEIKVIRFKRFCDFRGYFAETMRRSDMEARAELGSLCGAQFVQCNESFSRPGTIRGLHFQWNPYMGKLVRTVSGHMVDVVLDIRTGSPHFGKAILYDMPASPEGEWGEWLWVPPGFAHGNFFLEETIIEYFCTGEYSPGCEAGISPLAPDIDWTLSEPVLRELFEEVKSRENRLITEKDEMSFTLEAWLADGRSDNFLFENMNE